MPGLVALGLIAVVGYLLVPKTANATSLYTFTKIAEAKGGTSGGSIACSNPSGG